MALTKRRCWTTWVTGTNYHEEGFNRWKRSTPRLRDKLVLQRIKDNPHDRNAVAVYHGGLQIGWAARENAQVIAPLLDQGMHFDVVIEKYDEGTWDPHKKLRILLREQVQELVPLPPPPLLPPAEAPKAYLYLFTGEIGTSSSHRAVELQQGKAYRLRTAVTRSSIDLVDAGGGQAGWVRKADLPYWNDIADRLDRFYAVVEGGALHLSEDLGRLAPYLQTADVSVNLGTIKVQVGDKILINPQTKHITKETTMNFNAKNLITRLFETNKRVAVTAGYLEAGRLANRGIGRFLLARMSFLGRWINTKHVESPIGSLIIANGALALAQQFRPNDARIAKLTEAMATEAYQQVYQQIDIEGLIEGLMQSPDIKRALRNLGEDGAAPLVGESAADYLARTKPAGE